MNFKNTEINNIIHSIDFIITMIQENSSTEQSFLNVIKQFLKQSNTIINNQYLLSNGLDQYYTIAMQKLKELSQEAETAMQAIEHLYKNIQVIRYKTSQEKNEFSKQDLFKYINQWKKQDAFLVKKEFIINNDELETLIGINSHYKFNGLIDYLNLFDSYGIFYICRRRFGDFIHVEEDFVFTSKEMVFYKDNLLQLYAFKHRVKYETYLDWLDQINNPRCRSLKLDGTPCENMLSLKHAKNPIDFQVIEHTCCHLHRSHERYL